MISYLLTTSGGRVKVSLDTANINESVTVAYSGEADGVDVVREWLSRQYGAFGHLIGDVTTPIDLDAAMKRESAREFSAIQLEGFEVIKDYDPGISGESVT